MQVFIYCNPGRGRNLVCGWADSALSGWWFFITQAHVGLCVSGCGVSVCLYRFVYIRVVQGLLMYSRYGSVDEVPQVELRMEPLVREVGPERFWNAHNAVLTHIFNTLSVLDRHCLVFLIQALERVCEEGTALSEELVAHTELYIRHLKSGLEKSEEHVELIRQLGYDVSVSEAYRFITIYPPEKLDVRQLAALVNVYSWMTFCVSRFLLSQPWYVASAAAKSTVLLRWRWLIEEIHKGLLPELLKQLGGGAAVRRKAWWSVNWNGNRLFALLFLRLLKADGCFAPGQLFATLAMMYRVFLHPVRGFYRTTWQFMRLYQRNTADSSVVPGEQMIDEVLLNAQLYIAQMNPGVDNRVFFSGRYFRDLCE